MSNEELYAKLYNLAIELQEEFNVLSDSVKKLSERLNKDDD